MAMIIRPPAFGTKIKSVDAAPAKAMPGIIDVVTMKNNVAVVGNSTWEIMKARNLVQIEYEKDGDTESTSDHNQLLISLLDNGKTTERGSFSEEFTFIPDE